MDKKQCITELFNLKTQAESFPKIPGRTQLLKKISQSINWLKAFKAESPSKMPKLFFNECNQAVADMEIVVEEHKKRMAINKMAKEEKRMERKAT